jgi:hypothetical protein
MLYFTYYQKHLERSPSMSLSLDLGTKPAGLEVKTYGFGSMGNTVHLGDYEISLEDFLIMAVYVLP